MWISKLIVFVVFSALIFFSCKKEEIPFSTGRPDAKTWLVPKDEIIDAGVGKDGIPSVDAPNFTSAAEINNHFNDDLVLGFVHQQEAKAFPLDMLNWHEIINDKIGNLPMAITYCPLTGTGLGWGRSINGAVTTFGVSGLLYNNNLMPYDRLTNSTWSQQQLECVNGLFIGEEPSTYTLIETTLTTWKKAYPHSLVMNANTGFIRRYSEYPYQDYRTNQDLLFFPLNKKDERLPAKERVLGILEQDQSWAVRFASPSSDPNMVIIDALDQKFVVVRSLEHQVMVPFVVADPTNYQVPADFLPGILTDRLGNLIDLAGNIISGPNAGDKLEKPLAFMGYWFSWGAFYPNIKIVE